MLYSVIFSVVGLNFNFLPSLFQKRINLRTLWISKQMVKLNQSKKSPQNFSQGDQTFEKDIRMLYLLPQWHLYWRLSKTCTILLWWRYDWIKVIKVKFFMHYLCLNSPLFTSDQDFLYMKTVKNHLLLW